MENLAPAILLPGQPIERELEPGQTHGYLFELAAGQCTRLVAEQKGIDIVLRLFDAAGGLLTEVDSPTGTEGAEVASVLAEAAGGFRAEVIPSDSGASPGRYAIHLEPPRPATEADRRRIAGERTYHVGEELRRQGQAAEALAHYEQALELAREAEDSAGEAKAHLRMAWMLHDLGRWEESLGHGDAARQGFHDLGDRLGEAMALGWIGQAHSALGRPEEAVESHRAALEIFEQLGDPEGRRNTLDLLGDLLRRTGRTEEAFRAYEDLLDLALAADDVAEQTKTWNNLGNLYIFQNKLDAAQDSFEKVLELARQTADLAMQARGLRRLGDVFERSGRWREAREALEQSLALRRRLDDRRGEAVTLSSLGTVRMQEGDLEPARRDLEAALEIFREVGDIQGQAVALLKLSRVAHAAGDIEKALTRAQEALPLYEKAGDLQGQATARFHIARALAAQGQLDEARELIEKTISTVEELRSRTASLELRATYFASRSHYWDLVIETLMALHDRDGKAGYDVIAFEKSESWRARSFLDLLQGAQAGLREDADPRLLDEERRLREQLSHLEQNRQLELETATSDAELAPIEAREREILARLDRLDRELRRPEPAGNGPEEADTVGLHELQSELLDSETVLLSYFLGEKRSFLWRIGPRAFTSYELPGRAKIEAAAVEVRRLLQQVSEVAEELREPALRRLSRLLLGPVAKELGGKRLVVVAGGALQLLPFAALRDPATNKPLLIQHEIVQLPSASVLASLRDEPRKQRREAAPSSHLLAVVGDPVFPSEGVPQVAPPGPSELGQALRDVGLSGFVPLPYAGEEARAILGLVPKKLSLGLLGLNANRDRVLSGVLEPYHLLHFATHGLVHPDHPELSGLLLSTVDEKGQGRTGFLSLGDIYSLHLSADLVVLSACQTGLGRELPGEGLMGLTRGFFSAGASGMVVSLWQVSDRSTSELMQRFYKQLFEEELAPAAALRAAQLSMLEEEEWAAPFHWAGFIYQGDWRASFAVPGDDSIETKIVTPPAPAPADPVDDGTPGPKMPKKSGPSEETAG